MSEVGLTKVRELESQMMHEPQVPIETSHDFHAGVYARTIMIPRGVALTGALIKIPTLLIIQGNCMVTNGEHSNLIAGYKVIAAPVNRKTAYYAYDDTHITMLFATNATDIEEAEHEFTNEADQLLSRRLKGE
jgi:hypothetical protein